MYKIMLNYGGLFGQDDNSKGIEVVVYHPEKSPDGTHITSSLVFNAHMLRRLAGRDREALLKSLVPALEECMKEVDRRKELERNDR